MKRPTRSLRLVPALFEPSSDPCAGHQLLRVDVIESDGSRPSWLGPCPVCSSWRLPVFVGAVRDDAQDRRTA